MGNIVSDSYIKALLKTVYLSGVSNNKYQNSPVLSAIKKEDWGSGKEIKYAAQYGNGGNFGSVYNTLVNNPTSGVKNLEWTATQGYATGFFEINQPEILTSANERGAYMKVLANKMAGTFDGMSKMLAMYLYGGSYGVIDQVKEEFTLAASNTISITSAGALKLDVGSRFVIASAGADNKAVPSSATLNAICTVTAMDDTTITFSASVTGENVYVGDYIELYTARVGNEARGIEGLCDILPSYFDRTGSDWESYIGTDFRGVDRSVAASRLAGQFVKAGSGATAKSDALVTLLKKGKRAGGLNDMLIVNDEDWDKIGQELGIQTNLWQAVNEGGNKNSVTKGLSDLATAFGDAFISRTVIDPYCTEGKAYMFEKDDLSFYDLGNVSRVTDAVANDQLGKHDIESVGDQGLGDSFGPKLNMDKLFNIEQGTAGEYGPSMRISCNVFGAYVMRKTASSGVACL